MSIARRRFLGTSAVAGRPRWLGAPAIVRAQQATTWRCQSMWSASETTYKASRTSASGSGGLDGRLEIQPFSAGAVIGVFETLDAVSAGVLQAQSSWPGYWAGKDAGFAVIGDFDFAYQHPWQAEAWYYHRGGLQMLRRPTRGTTSIRSASAGGASSRWSRRSRSRRSKTSRASRSARRRA